MGGAGEEVGVGTVDHINEKLAPLVEQATSLFALTHKHNDATPEVTATLI